MSAVVGCVSKFDTGLVVVFVVDSATPTLNDNAFLNSLSQRWCSLNLSRPWGIFWLVSEKVFCALTVLMLGTSIASVAAIHTSVIVTANVPCKNLGAISMATRDTDVTSAHMLTNKN